MSLKKMRFIALASLLLFSCGESMDRELQQELHGSLVSFFKAVETRDRDLLNSTVFFPDTRDYRDHVNKLLVRYLDEVQEGKVRFDAQGIVLTRFLRLNYHRNVPIAIESLPQDGMVKYRVGVHFSYDALLGRADFEKGTKVFVPTEPFGTALVLEYGAEGHPAPRQQLSYIELVFTMKKTNTPGSWQVREVLADENTAEFETSYMVDF